MSDNSFWTRVRSSLEYIILPIGLLFGIIFKLFMQTKSLQDQLNREKADKELAGTLAKKEEAHAEADTDEARYRDALNKYNSER